MENVLANHAAVKETYAGISRRLGAYILDWVFGGPRRVEEVADRTVIF